MNETEGQAATSGWIGRVIDRRYRIIKRLGEGAMGEVFVAEHLKLHKQVALKVVRAELAGNREALARFAREAMAGSKIDHPSVVAALDYGALDDGGAYLIMPLVPGECLADVLQNAGPMHWAQAAALGAQIADALTAAWAQGFVHRDLKPDNILIEPREAGGPLARVLDFGVAKLSEPLGGSAPPSPSGGEQLTKEGAIIGTPGYMAPEQALGRPATHAADLYSLGVMLWEAIVGRPLWQGDSLHAIMRAQLKGSHPSLREASSDTSIPRALDQLVQSLLAVRPELRPESAVEVRDRLRDIIQTGAALASVPTPVAPAAPVQGLASVASAPPVAPARAMAAGTAAALGVLVAGAAILGLLVVGPFELSVADDQKPSPVTSRSPASGLPERLKPALQELLHGTSSPARAAAARQVMQHSGAGAVPDYAAHIARLELAGTCLEKKSALVSLNRLGDPRARPVLSRLSSQSATGCGPRKNQDCLGCLRSELREGLASKPKTR